MKSHSSKSVIVVPPGYPKGLIQELMETDILPGEKNFFEILLPPGSSPHYDLLSDRKSSFSNVEFISSPARSFFSFRHFKWLRDRLQSSEGAIVLIQESPYRDPTSAIISLLIMMLSDKTITLLRCNSEIVQTGPELIIVQNDRDFAERWILRQLNLKISIKELQKSFIDTFWNTLYFLLFWGLIIRKYLSNCFSFIFKFKH